MDATNLFSSLLIGMYFFVLAGGMDKQIGKAISEKLFSTTIVEVKNE